MTEGIRQTDAIEVFPCPVPDSKGCYLSKFFLHGIRWLPAAAVSRIATLQEDEPLKLMLDFQNEHDPFAVAVRTEADRMQIGYVPRYLARDVWQLGFNCGPFVLELMVSRVNLDAPLQNRVLCQMRGCWPPDFQPCSGEDFTPIPTGIPASCH
ncbi:MAG TPA: HIRAN domain-containing protein [Pirellulales bacterium]|nr:HIRAN domain-containing protein [Pirellulales bacterium]